MSSLLRFCLPIFFAVSIWGDRAFATAVLLDVSNSSNFDNTVTPNVIYGGTGGADPGNAGVALSDSCAGATGLYYCNSKRIHAGAILTLSFRSDTSGGMPVIWYQGTATGSTTSSVPLTPEPSSPTSAAVGQQTYVAIDWYKICAALSVDYTNIDATTCNDSGVGGAGGARGTFRLGFVASVTDSTAQTDYIDVQIAVGGNSTGNNVSTVDNCTSGTNPYGVCAWEVSPGDEKAVMTEARPYAGATGPTFNFKSVRVFYQPITDAERGAPPYTNLTAGTTTYQDLNIDTNTTGDISLSPSRVTGLTNGKTYMFKIGMVDLAGNVGYYTSNSTGPTSGIGDEYCENANRVYADTGNPNCHLSTPEPVVGALAKPISCFIATAAYGSPMAPQVETFRKFRNQILMPTRLGARFVDFYYEHSPKYAKIIAEHPVLRVMARTALWPFLSFAWLSIRIGSLLTAAIFAVALGAFGYSLRMVNRRRRA